VTKIPEDDIDAELISVLDEPPTKDEPPAKDEPPTKDEPPAKDELLEDKVPEPILVPQQGIEKISSNLLKIENQTTDDIGIKQLLSKFGASVDTIISNQRADRDQVEKAITLVEKKVKDAVDSGSKLSPAFLDAYARLLQTKAEINTNASKVLDSVAKLLAAGKGNDLIVNINNKETGGLDLESFLQQPKYEDEADGLPTDVK